METYSTGGVVAEIAGGITFGSILAYFGLEAQALMTLSIFLGVDILFGLLDSYFVTKDTSSKKLVEGLARKAARRALPFVLIAALKGVGYEGIDTIATIVMTTLILSEGYSIIGHIYSLNYKEKLPEIDAIKLLFEKITNIFKGQLPSKSKDEQDGGSVQ